VIEIPLGMHQYYLHYYIKFVKVHPKAVAEIHDLPVEMRAKLTRLLDFMKCSGPQQLREPHVKSLGNKLWEIRLTGKDGIARILYVTFANKQLALLHAFIKKTQKTPTIALERAMRRLKEMPDEYVG
jgi:phage-related protein